MARVFFVVYDTLATLAALARMMWFLVNAPDVCLLFECWCNNVFN